MKKLFYFALSIVFLSSCSSNYLSKNHYDLRLVKRELKEEVIKTSHSTSSKETNTLSVRQFINENFSDTLRQNDSNIIDTVETKIDTQNLLQPEETPLGKESKTTIQAVDEKEINNEDLSSFYLILGSVLLTIGILLIQFIPILAFLAALLALICAVLAPTLTKSKTKKNLSRLLKILCVIILVITAFWIVVNFLDAITKGIDFGIGMGNSYWL